MRDIWNRYARQEYTVFVDESFNRFLKVTVADSRYGYFSYGGVGVPSSEYASLRIAIAPILGDYLKLVPGGETEFKHSMFKRIPYDDRAMLADRIGLLRGATSCRALRSIGRVLRLGSPPHPT